MLKKLFERSLSFKKNIVVHNLTVSFEEAQEIILKSVTPLNCENISIMEASNRVLYEDIVSDLSLIHI